MIVRRVLPKELATLRRTREWINESSGGPVASQLKMERENSVPTEERRWSLAGVSIYFSIYDTSPDHKRKTLYAGGSVSGESLPLSAKQREAERRKRNRFGGRSTAPYAWIYSLDSAAVICATLKQFAGARLTNTLTLTLAQTNNLVT